MTANIHTGQGPQSVLWVLRFTPNSQKPAGRWIGNVNILYIYIYRKEVYKEKGKVKLSRGEMLCGQCVETIKRWQFGEEVITMDGILPALLLILDEHKHKHKHLIESSLLPVTLLSAEHKTSCDFNSEVMTDFGNAEYLELTQDKQSPLNFHDKLQGVSRWRPPETRMTQPYSQL